MKFIFSTWSMLTMLTTNSLVAVTLRKVSFTPVELNIHVQAGRWLQH